MAKSQYRGRDERPVSFESSKKLLNKTFYRFLFSFIAVVGGVLLFILILGTSNGLQ